MMAVLKRLRLRWRLIFFDLAAPRGRASLIVLACLIDHRRKIIMFSEYEPSGVDTRGPTQGIHMPQFHMVAAGRTGIGLIFSPMPGQR